MMPLVPEDTELLGGLELGGIPIATMLSQPHRPPGAVRAQGGQDVRHLQARRGPDVAGRRVTLVEDVITTGGAVRDATHALREAGAVVEVVVCAIDRSPEGENPLADVGLEVRPVLTKADLDAARAAAGEPDRLRPRRGVRCPSRRCRGPGRRRRPGRRPLAVVRRCFHHS